MPKFSFRILASLLVSSLIGDPILAATLAQQQALTERRSLILTFQEESLEAYLVIGFHVAPESQALSREVLKLIMRKVQDINRKGIAFHTVRETGYPKDFPGVLRNGLLGRTRSNRFAPSSWAKVVRKTKNAELYFNITGRFRNVRYKTNSSGNEIEEILPPFIENQAWGATENRTILFDLESFKEIEPRSGTEEEINIHLPVHSFTANFGGLEKSEFEFDQEGKPIVNSQLGFQLKARAAPRFFTGIVLGLNDGYNHPMASSEFNHRVEAAVQDMFAIYKSRLERLLPVYDHKGNLHWPIKMEYAKVKRVAQRNIATKRALTIWRKMMAAFTSAKFISLKTFQFMRTSA